MRQELTCQHWVGHSGGVHGCDGCCAIIADAVERGKKDERDRIRKAIESKRTVLAGLAGVGNAVLVEELLLEILDEVAS